ncbi:hypothetical protein K1719_008683 [Acacia pycnantha]|nr:hypothetical protein K1719_008683 [Acacia pycnantha]
MLIWARWKRYAEQRLPDSYTKSELLALISEFSNYETWCFLAFTAYFSLSSLLPRHNSFIPLLFFFPATLPPHPHLSPNYLNYKSQKAKKLEREDPHSTAIDLSEFWESA